MSLAIGALLTAAAGARGAVLVIDDLQHADEATSRLLRDLGPSTRPAPILVVGAFRAGALPAAMRGVRAQLLGRRAATEIGLGPLAHQEAVALARGLAPEAGDDALEAVWRLGAGNPFFTEELAAGIGADGRVRVPASLREVLTARLAGLGPEASQALACAAATGAEFSADDLAALSGMDEEAALAALDSALHAGVVESRAGGFGFRHPVVREALAGLLPEHRLAAAHRRAAARLRERGAPPARVARHLMAGERAREAVPWLQRAADEAGRVGGWGDALGLVESALPHADGSARADLLERRARLLLLTGGPSPETAFAEAIAASPPGRRTALSIRLAWAHLAAGRLDTAVACLDGLEPCDAAEAGRLDLARGVVAWHAGELDLARDLAERAESAVLQHGTPGEMRMAMNLRPMIAHAHGDWTGPMRSQLARTKDAPELEAMTFDAYLCIGEFALLDGDPFERVVAAADELRRIADETGARRALAFATALLGEAELMAAQLASAEEHLRAAVALSREVGTESGEVLAILRLGEALLARGAPDEGRRLVRRALEHARWVPLSRHLLPLAHEATIAVAGDVETALAAVETGEATLDPAATCIFCSVGYAAAATRGCAAGGRLDDAAGFLARAEAAAARWREGRWAAVIAEARGALAAARGESASAERELRRARDGFAAAGRVLNVARVDRALGALADRASSPVVGPSGGAPA